MGKKCKGKRRPRRGSIMLAVAIVSLVYYGILIIKTIHDRRHPAEYYNPGIEMVVSQCGPNGCSTPQWGGGQVSSSDAWQLPTHPSEPYIYKQGGREVGRINADGSRVGFMNGDPSWYPSGMPQAYMNRVADKATSNPDKPTGVNVDELAKEKAAATTGITVNGQPVTEGVLRDKLSDSARARGLRDYNDVFRIVIVGDEAARKEWVRIAEPFVKESNGKAIIQEYPNGSWQTSAHANAVKQVPEYQHGQPFAYIQTDTPRNVNGINTNVMSLAVTTMELGRALKDLRPEISPNFDPSKARAIGTANTQWIVWASVIGVAMLGTIGFLTGKPSDA